MILMDQVDDVFVIETGSLKKKDSQYIRFFRISINSEENFSSMHFSDDRV
jgi:hypothetical protein